MRLRSRYLLVLLTLVLSVGHAQAQDVHLKPTYGETTLKAGFLPDPYSKSVVAGGSIRTKLGGVNAFVARAPDFSLTYTKGTYPLSFHVKSAGDTTLLINLPNGRWIADDDSGGGLDPLIRLDNPLSGRYDIFVGTYEKEPIGATLYITELDPAKKAPIVAKTGLVDCYIVSAGVDNYPFLNKLKGDLNDARNTVAAFKNQTGMKFRQVHDRTLLDGSATHKALLGGFRALTTQGKANDFMVLFMSGHGGLCNGNRNWEFCPFDFHPAKSAATGFRDSQFLEVADQLVKQGKNVVIIVDACHSGQIHETAKSYMSRYTKTNEGGLIVMLACAPNQTSAALGNYSTFAKAFSDGMAGQGDLSKDGTITLSELKTYTQRRTDELTSGARQPKQNCVVAWSPSISKDLPFAYTTNVTFGPATPDKTIPSTRWTGNETLEGYGKLTFTMYEGGRAVMVDAKSTSEGIWRKEGNQYTLRFSNGAVVYNGTLKGSVLSGTASHPGHRQDSVVSWNWSVKQ